MRASIGVSILVGVAALLCAAQSPVLNLGVPSYIARPAKDIVETAVGTWNLLLQAPWTSAQLSVPTTRCNTYLTYCQQMQRTSNSKDYWSRTHGLMCQLALPACSSTALTVVHAATAALVGIILAGIFGAAVLVGASLAHIHISDTAVTKVASIALQTYATIGVANHFAIAALALSQWTQWCNLSQHVLGAVLPAKLLEMSYTPGSLMGNEVAGGIGLAVLAATTILLQLLSVSVPTLLNTAFDVDSGRQTQQQVRPFAIQASSIPATPELLSPTGPVTRSSTGVSADAVAAAGVKAGQARNATAAEEPLASPTEATRTSKRRKSSVAVVPTSPKAKSKRGAAAAAQEAVAAGGKADKAGNKMVAKVEVLAFERGESYGE
eukprot:jgi/Chrzof1/4527/Cz14g17030.t1